MTDPGDALTIRRIAGSDHLQFVYGGTTYGHPSTGSDKRLYELSRLLTGTVDEERAGVFTGNPRHGLLDCVYRMVDRDYRPATVVRFEAKGQTRTFRFTTLRSDDEIGYIRDEIRDRLQAVWAWVDGIAVTDEVALEVVR
jgi:hypothetical protein